MNKKSSFFDKNGWGVVIGTLTSPIEITYTISDPDGGVMIEKALLTGNVRETEYNNVIVTGQRIIDNNGNIVINVQDMESLYIDGPIKIFQYQNSQKERCYAITIPQEKFKTSSIKATRSGTTYTEIKAGGPNTFIFINTYENIELPAAPFPYVFVCFGEYTKKEESFKLDDKKTFFWFDSGKQLAN